MWSIGRFDLGLSDDEFWSLTIPHFNALVARLKKKFDYEAAIQKREDYRSGLVASVLYNTKLSKKNRNKAKEPLDWFKSKSTNNTVDKQKLAAMNWAKALGGEIRI